VSTGFALKTEGEILQAISIRFVIRHSISRRDDMPQQPQQRQNVLQDYITVAERIEKFYERYPDGRITTHIIEHDGEKGFILMRAEVYRQADDALPAATGHAFEVRSEGYVQRTSYIEVCETSSVGRALALCGFEVKRGLSNREDTVKAAPPERPAERAKAASPPKPVAAAEAAPKKDQPATEDQKDSILSLLERLRPGDRKAQRRMLVEITGKESRDDLTAREATELINRLKRESEEGSI